jgi:hypothetical protein
MLGDVHREGPAFIAIVGPACRRKDQRGCKHRYRCCKPDRRHRRPSSCSAAPYLPKYLAFWAHDNTSELDRLSHLLFPFRMGLQNPKQSCHETLGNGDEVLLS